MTHLPLKLNTKLHIILHILGLSCIGFAAYFQFTVHWNIVANSVYLKGAESNLLVAWAEVVMAVGGLAYVGWLIVSYFRLLWMIPAEVREEMKTE